MSNISNPQRGSIGRNLAMIIAGVLALIAVVLAIITNRQTPTQKQAATNSEGYQATADAFIKAMSKNDGQASWNLATDAFQKKIGSESEWQKQVSGSFSKTTGSPKFIKAEVQPDQYKVYKDQDPHRVTYHFTLNGGRWETVVIVVKDKAMWKVDEVDNRLL